MLLSEQDTNQTDLYNIEMQMHVLILLNKKKAGPITTARLILHYFIKITCIWFKKGIKLSESIIPATEDPNIGQNTHFNEMASKKHKKNNQFMKTYKFKSHWFSLILLSLSLFLLFPLRFHLPSSTFIYFSSILSSFIACIKIFFQ